MRRTFRRPPASVILAWLLLFPGAGASALEPLGIDGGGGYRLQGLVSLLRDPGGVLDAASANALAADFAPSGRTPNLGLTGDAVWLRFGLRNLGQERRRVFVVFEYPVADSVALSLLRAGRVAESFQAGDSLPSSPGLLPSRYFAFPVDLGPAEEIACLLRARSSSGMSLPIAILEEGELARASLIDSLLYGLLFGCLALVVLYLLASPRRERWLLWFCAYALAFGLHVAIRGGYARLLLGERSYPVANLANLVAIGLLYFTGAGFFRSFLGLRERSRALDGIMLGLQWLGLAFIPLALVPGPAILLASLFVNFLGPLFSISLAAVLWARRAPNAGLFALGWLVPHAVSMVDFLRINGAIPYSDMEKWMLPASLGIALCCLGWAVVRRRARDSALARVDSLTGLANRRRFDEALAEEWSRARRLRAPLALLMIDIDDFKSYNDARGHRAGDQCLREVAAAFSAQARRAGDLAARYGGEEFVLLLPSAGAEEASSLAELVRASVESRFGPEPGVTVSVGVASRVPVDGEGPEGLVGEADAALYRAKEGGKNKVVAAIM